MKKEKKTILLNILMLVLLLFVFYVLHASYKNGNKKIIIEPSQEYTEIIQNYYIQLTTAIKENNTDKVIEISKKFIQHKKTDYKDFLTITTNYLYEYVKPIPASNYKKNYEIYTFLNVLDPENALYSKKRDFYSEVAIKECTVFGIPGSQNCLMKMSRRHRCKTWPDELTNNT